MTLTANDFTAQMIAQLRLSDPSASGEVGTPENLILSTVGQELSANQIDLTGLSNAFNLDAKVGSNLDQFTQTFGMQRQQATSAQGYVIFSANSPVAQDTTIPAGTVVQGILADVGYDTQATVIQYFTTAGGVIASGNTASDPVPVQSVALGTAGNVDANVLTQIVGTGINNITSVTNPAAINTGLDQESDNAYNVRFKNTWARNLAGVGAQYLAIALSGAFTTKANVIGQESRYQEYIQIPDCSDYGVGAAPIGTPAYPYQNGGYLQTTFAPKSASTWFTTALSDIPYAKQIYTNTATFVSDSNSNFFRPGVDYVFNSPAAPIGDALRANIAVQLPRATTPVSGGPYTVPGGNWRTPVGSYTSIPLNPDTDDFPSQGNILVIRSGVIANPTITIQYTGVDGTNLTKVQCSVLADTFTIQPGDVIVYCQVLPPTSMEGSAQVIYVETVEGLPNTGSLVMGIGILEEISTVDSNSQPLVSSASCNYTGLDYNSNAILLDTSTLTGSGTLAIDPISDPSYPSQVYYYSDTEIIDEPNFTFFTVYGSDTTPPDGAIVLTPGEVVLSEYSYISTASRNDLLHNVNNAVDVYVDGQNPSTASDIFSIAQLGGNLVQNNPLSPWYVDNYRRDGEPATRPIIGNILIPLFQQPLTSLPSSITVVTGSTTVGTFNLGVDYWLVHEVDNLGGSIRARDSIEWNTILTGAISFADLVTAADFINVSNYSFDANITSLQATYDGTKQITTDVLVHSAKTRFFVPDITIVTSPNSSFTVVESAVQEALSNYFSNQYFGAIITLSQILSTVLSVSGVEDVRWSNDLPVPPTHYRVLETDINANPLHGASIQTGYFAGGSTDYYNLTITGSPNGYVAREADSFTVTFAGFTTALIPFFDTETGAAVTDTQISTAINTALSVGNAFNFTVLTPTTPTSDNLIIFGMTPGADYGSPSGSPTITNYVTASTYDYDTDFFLLDDELAALPANGAIIRQRAQNTWQRPGLG